MFNNFMLSEGVNYVLTILTLFETLSTMQKALMNSDDWKLYIIVTTNTDGNY